MAAKKVKTRKRTKKIKIVQGDGHHPGEHTFKLHIGPVKSPRDMHKERKELHAKKKKTIHAATPHKPRKAAKRPKKATSSQKPFKNVRHHIPTIQQSKLSVRIWNTLEWLAVSALIFMVIFFAINYSSYSELFISKLNQLRGDFKISPYVQQLLDPGSGMEQELLSLTSDSKNGGLEIPELSLEIAPPDNRIIIPRINKSVPVVNVSTENLLKRDWGALEEEIQEALRGGVVHYPGTAQAGQEGNVVITGHSSYFPWDPGRFKDVFALLHEVAVGDKIIVYHEQEKLTFQVYETKVVTPDKISILTQEGENRLTLLTCTPVGTNLKRLVVFAKPI